MVSIKQYLIKRMIKLDSLLLPECKGRERFLPYIMLAYLFFYFFPLSYQSVNAQSLLIAGVALVAFLITYFHLFWVSQNQRIPHLLIIWLLGIAITPFYHGGYNFVVYAAALSCTLGTVTRSSAAVILVALGTVLVTILREQSLTSIMPVLFFILVVGSINIYFVDIQRKKTALDLSHQEVREMAKIAERERIARDLHDRIGHTFSVITLKAELARKLLDKDPVAAAKELADLESLSRATLAQVRDVVSDYRKSSLQAEMLNARLALDAAGIRFDFSISPDPLPEKVDDELSNILREGITNIIRHSNASYCEVSLYKTNLGFTLDIVDNGKTKSCKEGNGLRGIRERAHNLGGEMAISTGDATRLSILIPV